MTETYYSFNLPCKLALIADSHDQPVPNLKESLEKNRPDMICIAGDFVYGHPPKNGLKMDESQNAMQLIRECVSAAWTCVSFGNHEWLLNEKDIEIIRSAGAVVLDNSWVEKDGILFGGLTSGGMMNYRKYIKDHQITNVGKGESLFTTKEYGVAKNDWHYRFHDLTVQAGEKVILDSALIDFKHYFTVPPSYLYHHRTDRLFRLEGLFAEQITLKFATYLSRVAIP